MKSIDYLTNTILLSKIAILLLQNDIISVQTYCEGNRSTRFWEVYSGR